LHQWQALRGETIMFSEYTIRCLAVTSLVPCMLFSSSTGEAGLVHGSTAVVREPAAAAPVEGPPEPEEDQRAPLVMTALNRRGDRLEVQPYDREGNLIPTAHEAISRFLRCQRTGRVQRIHPGAVALLYQISRDYPGHELVVVSGFRADDRRSSPHRQARAVDLRVSGVSPARLSRQLWTTYDGIAVGYYPALAFVHVDVRDVPVRWVQRGGINRYEVHARAARPALKPVPSTFPLDPPVEKLLVAAGASR
jgi:uncharacterized protein YcbK (DUF882 family)